MLLVYLNINSIFYNSIQKSQLNFKLKCKVEM